MKDSLKRITTRLNPFNSTPAKAVAPAPAPAPAVVVEAEEEGYSSAAAEKVINELVDALEKKNAQMVALVKVNHELTAQLAKSTATLKQFYALPRNKYWNQRKG